MKLATVDIGDGTPSAALLVEDRVFPVRSLTGRGSCRDVAALISTPLTPSECASLVSGRALHPHDVTWFPPVLNPPKNVFCVGKNYMDHVLEGARAEGSTDLRMPAAPQWFSKPHTALVGHQGLVPLDPSFSSMVDYEGELAVVIGRSGRAETPEQAADLVFGYTIMNDVTARDVQQRHGQWFKGKGADGYAPCGPWIATKDEVEDPQDLEIVTRVNGEIRQQGNTRDMLFGITELILDLSQGITLEAGDLIATGTPAGVGWGRAEYLSDGDVVTISVSHLGELESRFRNVNHPPRQQRTRPPDGP